MPDSTQHARRGSPLRAIGPPPAPGFLLRLPVGGPRWAEEIPPCPAEMVVTVALSSPDVDTEHGEALALLGYRVVQSLALAAPSADFLVDDQGLAEHPEWRAAMVHRAQRVWDLSFGPVRRMLDEVLRAHR